MRLMRPSLTCLFPPQMREGSDMFLARAYLPLISPPLQMREGSDTFLVHAYLPVEASFGLADEMRRKCSGAASVSLLLSHWERVEVGDSRGRREG